MCLLVTLKHHLEDSASEDGETSTELVLPEENGERHMKPVRILRFSGIYFVSLTLFQPFLIPCSLLLDIAEFATSFENKWELVIACVQLPLPHAKLLSYSC